MAADNDLVDQVVKFAFFIRLASLLLVVLTPSEVIRSPAGLAAITFIAITSAAGLYRTSAFTRGVASHPIVLVVDVLIASTITSVVGTQSPLVLYTLSTAVLIGILLAPAVAGLVMAILISSFLLVAILDQLDGSAMSTLLLPVTYATVGALGSLTRSLHETAMREQAVARRYSEDAAGQRERARLARDMHDSVAKSLHGIGLAAAALPKWAEQGSDQIVAKALELQAAAETASQEARDILVELRADEDDRTLAQLLRQLVDDLTAGGLGTSLTVEGVGDCDHALKGELISIAGEAVENVRRHSRATQVTMHCIGTIDSIELQVRDDGVGFAADSTPADHFGLLGMRERAEGAGGTFILDSGPGAGTTVTVTVPRTSGAS